MTKKEIIELYIKDLTNIVPKSDARDNRISMLTEKLENLDKKIIPLPDFLYKTDDGIYTGVRGDSNVEDEWIFWTTINCR